MTDFDGSFEKVGLPKEYTAPGTLLPKEKPQWCEKCKMWLNGPCQYEDHLLQRKHYKNDPAAKALRKKKKAEWS